MFRAEKNEGFEEEQEEGLPKVSCWCSCGGSKTKSHKPTRCIQFGLKFEAKMGADRK